uniref:Uncharacterized protein n=1 Tax=Rhizophora mucronata TaxID=61149 RepID=A0A2P2R2Z1_RHIMU
MYTFTCIVASEQI